MKMSVRRSIAGLVSKLNGLVGKIPDRLERARKKSNLH